jgi:quercetin dioxygenase-like cupin family protein
MNFETEILRWQSMYPSAGYMVGQQESMILPDHCLYSSIYGYAYADSEIRIGPRRYQITGGQYYSFFVTDRCIISTNWQIFVAVRLGFKTVDQLGTVEPQGRLSYIDGCSDSLLVYPPRQGDPSLNLLYFPPGIKQAHHRHPSLRLGCVIHGQGYAEYQSGQVRELSVGQMFCLDEHELHRFYTDSHDLTVIAFHPDGDWGPTDHNHTVLNRTYIDK